VFSPALTDGSLGDMMYFHSYRNPGLVLDIIQGKEKSVGFFSLHFVAVL
jgi:Deoxyhypusine synthase